MMQIFPHSGPRIVVWRVGFSKMLASRAICNKYDTTSSFHKYLNKAIFFSNECGYK
jgi:hypothetical protein